MSDPASSSPNVTDDLPAPRKYVIGADGAKSSIRKRAEIEFIGERSSSKWIRMDVRALEITRPMHAALSPLRRHW